MDQITDRAALMDPNDVGDHHDIARLLREVPAESSNTSGLAPEKGPSGSSPTAAPIGAPPPCRCQQGKCGDFSNRPQYGRNAEPPL